MSSLVGAPDADGAELPGLVGAPGYIILDEGWWRIILAGQQAILDALDKLFPGRSLGFLCLLVTHPEHYDKRHKQAHNGSDGTHNRDAGHGWIHPGKQLADGDDKRAEHLQDAKDRLKPRHVRPVLREIPALEGDKREAERDAQPAQ